jgi:hypothetical protein
METTMTYRPYELGFARLPIVFSLTLRLVEFALLIAVVFAVCKAVPSLRENETVQSHLPTIWKYFTLALWFLGGLAVAVVFQAIKNICMMCVTILDKMELEEKSRRRQPAI